MSPEQFDGWMDRLGCLGFRSRFTFQMVGVAYCNSTKGERCVKGALR